MMRPVLSSLRKSRPQKRTVSISLNYLQLTMGFPYWLTRVTILQTISRLKNSRKSGSRGARYRIGVKYGMVSQIIPLLFTALGQTRGRLITSPRQSMERNRHVEPILLPVKTIMCWFKELRGTRMHSDSLGMPTIGKTKIV